VCVVQARREGNDKDQRSDTYRGVTGGVGGHSRTSEMANEMSYVRFRAA
jgi:hypothetical protein